MASHDPLKGFRADVQRTWKRKDTLRWILGFVFQACLVGAIWLLAPFILPSVRLGILAALLALYGVSGPWLIWLITEEFRGGDRGSFGVRNALSAAIAVLFSASMLFMAAVYAFQLR